MGQKVLNGDTMELEEPLSSEQEEAEKKAAEEAAAAEAKKKEEEEEEEEVDDPEKKKKEGEDDDDPDKKKDDDDDEEPIDVDDFIKDAYAEKYEINSVEDLDQVLERTQEILDENESLKEQLKAKADTKPKFESDAEEKAFNFIKEHGVDRITDGTYARLVTMDVKNTDNRLILEEEFIMEHPELTREESMRKFTKEFNRKYGPVDRDKYDDEAKVKEEEEDRRIALKSASAKAARKLEAKQKEYKAEAAKKKTEVEKPENKVPEVIEKSIVKNAKQYDEFLDETNSLIFSPTDDKKDDFPIQFSKEQLKNIRAVCQNWVKNPASYNEKGQLVDDADPATTFKRAARMLYGDEMDEKIWKHALEVTSIKRIEEIGDHKSGRKSKVATATDQAPSEDAQIEEMINKKKKR